MRAYRMQGQGNGPCRVLGTCQPALPQVLPMGGRETSDRLPYQANGDAESLTVSTLLNLAHGTRSRYTKGCRCDLCRDANARYSIRQRWANRGHDVDWPDSLPARITKTQYAELRQLAHRKGK